MAEKIKGCYLYNVVALGGGPCICSKKKVSNVAANVGAESIKIVSLIRRQMSK